MAAKAAAAKPIDYSKALGVGKQVAEISSGVVAAQPYLLEAQKWQPRMAEAEALSAGSRATAEAAQVDQRWGGIYEGLRGSAGYGTALRDWEARQQAGADLYGQLERSAIADLARGGRLDAWQQREASQAARAAFQDRGLATGSSAALAEVLNRANFSEARKRERQAYAAQLAGNAQGWAAGNMQVAASQFDPYQRMYGKGGSAMSGTLSSADEFETYGNIGANLYATQTQAQVAREQMAMQEDMFKQQMAYDKWATIYNAAAGRAIGDQNAAAARRAGHMALAGSAIGAVGVAAGLI